MSDEDLTSSIDGSNVRRTLRKFTEAQRAQIVAESFVAGAVVAEVAKRHGITPNLLSYWRALSRTTGKTTKGDSKSEPKSVSLAAVRVNASESSDRDAASGVIEIDLDRRLVRVRGVVNAALLREVLAATR